MSYGSLRESVNEAEKARSTGDYAAEGDSLADVHLYAARLMQDAGAAGASQPDPPASTEKLLKVDGLVHIGKEGDLVKSLDLNSIGTYGKIEASFRMIVGEISDADDDVAYGVAWMHAREGSRQTWMSWRKWSRCRSSKGGGCPWC